MCVALDMGTLMGVMYSTILCRWLSGFGAQSLATLKSGQRAKKGRGIIRWVLLEGMIARFGLLTQIGALLEIFDPNGILGVEESGMKPLDGDGEGFIPNSRKDSSINKGKGGEEREEEGLTVKLLHRARLLQPPPRPGRQSQEGPQWFPRCWQSLCLCPHYCVLG